MKKYIILTLFCSLIGINTPLLQVQAMQGSEEEMGQQCAICICQGEEEEEENGPLETLPCGHTFHDKCIRQWVAKKPICPLCRIKLPKDMFVAVADSGRGGASQANPMALIDAAYDGRLEVVQALLAAGALASMADQSGMTALHLASSRCHLEVVQALLAAGALASMADQSGMTALHFAASSGNVEVVTALLAAGAHLNAQNQAGITALHFAASDGNVEVVQALLGVPGIIANAADGSGWTARARARQNHHEEIVRAIDDHMAQQTTDDHMAQQTTSSSIILTLCRCCFSSQVNS